MSQCVVRVTNEETFFSTIFSYSGRHCLVLSHIQKRQSEKEAAVIMSQTLGIVINFLHVLNRPAFFGGIFSLVNVRRIIKTRNGSHKGIKQIVYITFSRGCISYLRALLLSLPESRNRHFRVLFIFSSLAIEGCQRVKPSAFKEGSNKIALVFMQIDNPIWEMKFGTQ